MNNLLSDSLIQFIVLLQQFALIRIISKKMPKFLFLIQGLIRFKLYGFGETWTFWCLEKVVKIEPRVIGLPLLPYLYAFSIFFVYYICFTGRAVIGKILSKFYRSRCCRLDQRSWNIYIYIYIFRFWHLVKVCLPLSGGLILLFLYLSVFVGYYYIYIISFLFSHKAKGTLIERYRQEEHLCVT